MAVQPLGYSRVRRESSYGSYPAANPREMAEPWAQDGETWMSIGGWGGGGGGSVSDVQKTRSAPQTRLLFKPGGIRGGEPCVLMGCLDGGRAGIYVNEIRNSHLNPGAPPYSWSFFWTIIH